MLPFAELKQVNEIITRAINKAEEPKEELLAVAQFLNAMAENDGIALEPREEPEKSADGAEQKEQTIDPKQPFTKAELRYILEDMSPSLVKKMCRERSNDDSYLAACGTLLEAFLNLMIAALKRKHFNPEFLLACRQIFDYDCVLHRWNYQIPEKQLQSLFTKSAGQAWRADLKEGDYVDALLHNWDRTGSSRGAGWSQAKITKVDGDSLSLQYLKEPASSDRELDRWSIELASFESETKGIWEWKQTLKADDPVDAQDDTHKWLAATIMQIYEATEGERVFPMAVIGLRVYTPTGARSDEKGAYDGFGDRFDERIPLYSPKICKFRTMSIKRGLDDEELDETLDDYTEPAEGHDRAWGVPRPRRCTSSEYLRLLNVFCHKGGLDLVLQILEKEEPSDEPNGFNLWVLAILLSLASLPAQVYHKQVIADYAPRLRECGKNRLLQAPDRALRDVRREAIEGIVKAIDALGRRLTERAEREKQTELLKLEVALLCLKSSYMERRIQGIRDLNSVIGQHRRYSSKVAGKYLVDWMLEKGVFGILFDPKKTHLQLVQRCEDVLRLLLQEDALTPQLLQDFWSLTKTELRTEAYKIIQACSASLRQQHLDFIFEQMSQHTARDKLDMEEFNCLSELGKYSKQDGSNFQERVAQFFWDIILDAETQNLELISSCTQKYRDMVRYWSIEKKQGLLQRLVKAMLAPETPTLPGLKLLKGLIKDQDDRSPYSNYSHTNTYSGVGTYPPSGGSGTGAIRSRNDQQAQSGDPDADDEDPKEPQAEEVLTLQVILQQLQKDPGLVEGLLNDLTIYYEKVGAQIKAGSSEQATDRRKFFVSGSLYSHHDEVDERLQFLKFFASVSEGYCISKKELGVIYDLLVTKSCIETDQQEFLVWCKSSCESQTAKAAILDLREVGEFFTHKIANKELDVKKLSAVGLEFLQLYFISVNEKEEKLERISSNSSSNTTGDWRGVTTHQATPYRGAAHWNTSRSWNQQKTEDKKEEEVPAFQLKSLPQDLSELEMLWTLVLECQEPDVVPKVIDFLIKVYTQFTDEMKEQRKEVLESLVNRCMSILAESLDKDYDRQVRVIRLLKTLIHETEVTGAGSIVPHGALLRGEALVPLRIRNRVTLTAGELSVRVYSNTTLWELKKTLAETLDFTARYLRVSLGAGGQLSDFKDADNGKTMKALGLTGGELLTASKATPDDYIAQAPLVDAQGELTAPARRVFCQWFEMFRETDGAWSAESVGHFVHGCCGEPPGPGDSRVAGFFADWDKDGDGRIQLCDFVSFYATASRDKAAVVRENLKAFNVRPDLVKWSDVGGEDSTAVEDLPRNNISRSQKHFDQLMALLGQSSPVATSEAWELIQILATNQTFYRQVLKLDIAKDAVASGVDWERFFDKASAYRLLYTLQIVEAVLEDGRTGTARAVTLNPEAFATSRLANRTAPIPGAPSVEELDQLPEAAQKSQTRQPSQIAGSEAEEAALRGQWAEEFLTQGGFQYILKDFMACKLPAKTLDETGQPSEALELKYVAFMLHLLRTFLMAAYATSDANAFAVVDSVRRSSSAKEGPVEEKEEKEAGEPGDSFKQLAKLLEGPLGLEVLDSVDYPALQGKVLGVIQQVLSKPTLVFDDKLIINNALSLWVGCLLHQSSLIQAFVQAKGEDVDAEKLVLDGLLHCPYESVREEFKESFGALCRRPVGNSAGNTPGILEFTLRLLSQNFASISDYSCQQFLELFSELLDLYCQRLKDSGSKSQTQVIDPDALLSAVIDQISAENQRASKARAEGQMGQSSDPSGTGSSGLSLGLITLAGKILDNFGSEEGAEPDESQKQQSLQKQKGLIDELFTRFLFPVVFASEGQEQAEGAGLTMPQVMESQRDKKPGALNAESKIAAYKLLLGLLRRSSQLMSYFLENCIKPVMNHVERPPAWNYSPPSSSAGGQVGVGLRNLGCICYMNSMLQQFFAIPTFRYNLLCVEDGLPPNQKPFKGEQVDDNLLHQIQKLMANLELSERSEYNPWEFCFSFKEFDGTPTNTAEQKDAQEFLNLLFDRLETALKGTSRERLLSSVFGGRTCSQLVCKECGKVKNRIEPYYNLSLDVKDIKGVHESLAKLVEGETISDYECSGCKKKVDVSKRTLITQTPNVLIVHLQRIIFNFDTFQNDKMNQYYEFPKHLDLAPYSYYEVMGKENRLPKKKEGEEEEDANPVDQKGEEEDGDDEEQVEPEMEDCFEYELAGVTVHSGTAHAGHYWALIDTARYQPGNEEKWGSTETWEAGAEHHWKEFNDSIVRDFNVNKLKDECYGGDGHSSGGIGMSSLDGWGFGGGSYGKSAYMLFYERKKKRPISLVQPSTKPAAESEGATVAEAGDDKKAPEPQVVEVDYHRAVLPSEKPNRTYQKVLEDNDKFGFENDIYQPEFFDFVLSIQKAVAGREGQDEAVQALRRQAVTLGTKNTLEILARACRNNMIDEHVAALAELLQKDASGQLVTEFMAYWSEQDDYNFLISLILESPDTKARSCVASLMKYILVRLKMKEKDYLFESEEYEFEGDEGKKVTLKRHKSLSARFIVKMLDLLNTKAARNWAHFEDFLELFYVFAVADTADVEKGVLALGTEVARAQTTKQYDTKTEAARVGLDFFAQLGFVTRACDFMLGKKSPLWKGEQRPEMGSYYSSPDFSGIIKLLSILIADEGILEKYPLKEQDRELILTPSLLKTALGSATASKAFGVCLARMCRDDEELSRSVAKVFLTSIEQAAHDVVGAYLKALRPFLCTNDSLKQKKLEWIFGVPALLYGRAYAGQTPRYGLDLVSSIGEECLQFNSPVLFAGSDEALVAQIIKCKGRLEQQCVACLKELLGLMAKDRDVAVFVWNLPAASYQTARFVDWFRPYLQEQLAEQSRLSASLAAHHRAKTELLNKALAHLETLEPLFKELEAQEMERMKKCLVEGGSGEFTDIAEHWIGASCDEVIKHFPPQLILGQAVSDEREIYTFDNDPHVRVQMFEVDHEYAYSAPTGLFNLAVPHVGRKTHHFSIETYEQHAKALLRQKAAQESSEGKEGSEQQQMSQEDRGEAQEAAVEEFVSPARPWAAHKRVAPILLRVLLTNKSETEDIKVWYRLGSKSGTGANIKLPLSSKKAYISARGQTQIECYIKIDPSKNYFFESNDDIVIELTATVKDNKETGGTGGRFPKRVRLQPQEDALVVRTGHEDDDEEREGDDGYGYPGNTDGYGGDEEAAVLNLRASGTAEVDGDRQSNGSTDAVLGNAGDAEDAGDDSDQGDFDQNWQEPDKNM